MDFTINFWAVIVSAIVNMIIGSLWFGPLFGKKFMEVMGFEKLSEEERKNMQKGMYRTYLAQFIACLVMFYALAWFMAAVGWAGAGNGALLGFIVWIGFFVPFKLGEELWGGKMALFWIGAPYMLVTLLAAGAIIGGWQ